MSIVIGIEGGGTSTRILVKQDSQPPEYLKEGLSLKVVRDGFAESALRLRHLLGPMIGDSQIDSIAIGLAGMNSEINSSRYRDCLKADSSFAKTRISVQGDASLTLDAALNDKQEGVLAIAGTGSVVFIKLENENIRLGGWGPILSDEGSGQWMGLKALQWFVAAFDGREEKDALYHAVKRMLPQGIAGQPGMLSRRIEQEPQFAAQFTPAVFQARQESRAAEEIVNGAAIMLSGLIRAGLDRLTQEPPHTVALAGSIAKHKVIVEHLSHSMFDLGVDLRLVDDMAPVKRALEIAERQMG